MRIHLFRSTNKPTDHSEISSQQPASGNSLLIDDIDHAKKDIETLLLHLDYQTDPDMIDCYTYQLKGAYMRYKFLLRQIQEAGLVSHNV